MTDRRQRQKELRAQKRAQEQKAATRREFRRRMVLALVVGVSLVASILLFSLDREDEGGLPSGYTVFRGQPTACGANAPPEWVPRTFEAAVDQGALPATAVIETSCGPITIALNSDAPETVNSFVFLAREGFYDGLMFHRVLPNFSITAGDPEGDGTGGAGYALSEELPPEGFVYEPGVVAMADSGGLVSSQFFIVSGPDASVLTSTFSVLGRVTAGEETIEAITRIPLTQAIGGAEESRPSETVYIESISFND
jgi:cyclophilin family peptidyl-prolyl cis-trans isomerase